MKIFIYEYVGEYCHGGYVCIAENTKRSKELLIDGKPEMIEDFTANGEKLELKWVIPTLINEEKILLNSYDCC
jgi:hypothetical protein